MAESTINVQVQSLESGNEADKALHGIAKAGGIVSPELNSLAEKLSRLREASRLLGVSLGVLIGPAGAIYLAVKAFKFFSERAEEAADSLAKLSDAAADAEMNAGIMEANHMRSGGVTNDEYQTAQTRQEQAKVRRDQYMQLYREMANILNSTKDPEAAKTKVAKSMSDSGLYTHAEVKSITRKGGVQEMLQEVKKRYDLSEKERKNWERVTSAREKVVAAEAKAQEKKEKSEEKQQEKNKTWMQTQFDNAQKKAKAEARKEERERERKKREDERSKIKRQNEEVARIRQQQREQARAAAAATITVGTVWKPSQFMNRMDSLGGYTTNLMNAHVDPTISEMKKQTFALEKIEQNTKQTNGRFA